jgi:hypothetical protein
MMDNFGISSGTNKTPRRYSNYVFIVNKKKERRRKKKSN